MRTAKLQAIRETKGRLETLTVTLVVREGQTLAGALRQYLREAAFAADQEVTAGAA